MRMSAEQRKEEILGKAVEIFATHGYRGTRIRQIAEACGISESGILYFFKNKKELQVHSFFHVLENLLYPKELDKSDIAGSLVEFAEQVISSFREKPVYMRFLFQVFLSEREQTKFYYESAAMKDSFMVVKEHIELGKAKGLFRDIESELAVRAYWGIIVYLVINYEFFGPDAVGNMNPAELADKYINLFLRGLAI